MRHNLFFILLESDWGSSIAMSGKQECKECVLILFLLLLDVEGMDISVRGFVVTMTSVPAFWIQKWISLEVTKEGVNYENICLKSCIYFLSVLPWYGSASIAWCGVPTSFLSWNGTWCSSNRVLFDDIVIWVILLVVRSGLHLR